MQARRVSCLIAIAVWVIMLLSMPARAAWPTAAQWIPTLGVDWSYVADPLNDVNPRGRLDLVTDMTSSSGAAAYWYFDGTSLYFRMIVDEDPVKDRGTASAELHPFGWNILIESTGDLFPDYAASADGTGSNDTLHTLYNTGIDTVVETETGYGTTAAPNSAYVDGAGNQVLVNGYIMSKQVTMDTTKFYNGNPDFYIDFMVPLSWFARSNGAMPPQPIASSTPIKFAIGTGASGSTINKDLAGQSATTDISGLFNVMPPTTIESASYGILRDTRDAASPPGMGIWNPGEIVLVSGSGWPINSSQYFRNYLGIRIVDPSNHAVWGGTVPCTPSGTVTNAPTVTIGSSFTPGIYSILVEDPRSLGSYNSKDTFTVPSPPVVLTNSSKSVDKAEAIGGDVLLYTITVRNTGSGSANGIKVSDILSPHTAYLTGSTTSGGTSVPDAAGGACPLIAGIVIPSLGPGATHVITFRASIIPTTPNQTVIINVANISFASVIYVFQASTQVNSPVMTITKSVSPASSVTPGTTLTYTINFSNIGNSPATVIEIIDLLPAEVAYIPGSASATQSGGTFSYRYVPGGPFEAYDNLNGQVIAVRYILPVVSPGVSGTISIAVTVR